MKTSDRAKLLKGPAVQGRYFYNPPGRGWREIMPTRPRNTHAGHDALIARWNREQQGKLEWSWEPVLPDDCDFDPID